MAGNTPNLNLYKKDPTVDGNDTFNIKTMLNDNWDKIDASVTAKADKVDFSSHLADNTAHGIGTHNTAFNQNFETSTTNIKMDGTVSVGLSNNVARSDHVHPSDNTKLNKAGDTMSGNLTVNATVNATALQKGGVNVLTYNETLASGTTGLHRTTMSTAAPSGGSDGDIWLQYV
ncbi:hypothetical protein [Clostridium sp. OS1-26]|uniref:hypothetical protein n=1 Tax=Clostridium sp. OS1-26 TaxID=3070681 RepID=UPI0027E0955F|nr:hypothetical protein [Clostridium sp. OS1-26]WML35940.1 hypothetical protein RCG18_04115 [Clostridium sp. OS1-26]